MNTKPTIAHFPHILTVIQVVTHDIAAIATAIAVLMLVVAALFLMFDRDGSQQARTARMDFIKTVLIAYGIIIAAVFILATISQAFAAGGII